MNRMEDIMAYASQHRYFLIGIAASIMGCAVRVSHNQEVNNPGLNRIFGYYLTGMFLGYICYSVLELTGFIRATGLVCAISGLLSKEVMRFLIIDLPKIFPAVFQKWVYKKLGISEDETKRDNTNNN